MVLLGGLEIVAAGYLLNEFNKDKVDERTKRRHRRKDEDRPHSRPPHADRPQYHQSDSLRPPQAPPRPLSAPPQQPHPGPQSFEQQQQQPQRPPPPYQQVPQQVYQQRPPASQPVLQQAQGYGSQQIPNNPYLAALHNDQHQPPQAAPWQHRPAELQGSPAPPGPGQLQRPNTFQPQAQSYSQGLPPPGPGHFQQHNTFPAQPPAQRPQQQPFKPAQNGPLQYIDMKTGKVSHNLYPADHPMARGNPDDGNGESTRGQWGDRKYMRSFDGEMNSGMRFTERDEDDLAYGKDYSNDGRRQRSASNDTRRERCQYYLGG